MYEIEVKARVDPERMRQRVRELGAEQIEIITQIDTYYDHPSRSFAASDEALRIRRQHPASSEFDQLDPGPTTLLTYKGPRVDSETKTRVEHETSVGDHDAIKSILDAVSFDAVFTVEKTRELYTYSEFHITIDQVSGLGNFVEVEAEGITDDLDRLRSEATSVLNDLGVASDEFVQSSYLELLQEK